ncbi:molybdopterin molybdotransferase MoeA [Arthrobacter sp. HLT1-20]
MRRTVAEHQSAVVETLRLSWSQLNGSVMADGGSHEPLMAGLGRVLAADLVAPLDLPPFANSQMDGYAIGVETRQPTDVDSAQSTDFRVAATIPAGVVPAALGAGVAAPIMTGAMVPEGANAVVPVERAVPAAFLSEGDVVELPVPPAGTFVRAQGSDVRRGSVVIPAGTLLNAAHLGLAAALGCSTLPLRRQVRVLLLTTGDEILAPTGNPEALPAGMIFDANETLLRASLAQASVEVVDAVIVRDDPAALLQLLDSHVGDVPATDGAGASRYDLVLSVGGISAGAFEVVRQALGAASAGAESNAAMEFVAVGLQPGGPQALGTYRGVPFLGFPGNPVSAFVSFELFLRPALFSLLGAPAPRQRVVAALEHGISSPPGKHQVRRGVYSGPEFESAPSVREVGGESSHLLGSLAQADALIHIPAGVTELHPGAKVEVWLL